MGKEDGDHLKLTSLKQCNLFSPIVKIPPGLFFWETSSREEKHLVARKQPQRSCIVVFQQHRLKQQWQQQQQHFIGLEKDYCILNLLFFFCHTGELLNFDLFMSRRNQWLNYFITNIIAISYYLFMSKIQLFNFLWLKECYFIFSSLNGSKVHFPFKIDTGITLNLLPYQGGELQNKKP